jgi:hypothetical protein
LTSEIDNKWVQVLNFFDVNTISYVVQKNFKNYPADNEKTNNQVALVTPNE